MGNNQYIENQRKILSPSYSECGHTVLAAIPCFNTEDIIGNVISMAKDYANQIIIVDDGSYDGTAKEARNAGAAVIKHEVNRIIDGGIRYLRSSR